MLPEVTQRAIAAATKKAQEQVQLLIKQKESAGMLHAPPPASQRHVSELEVNDFPQTARWKVLLLLLAVRRMRLQLLLVPFLLQLHSLAQLRLLLPAPILLLPILLTPILPTRAHLPHLSFLRLFSLLQLTIPLVRILLRGTAAHQHQLPRLTGRAAQSHPTATTSRPGGEIPVGRNGHKRLIPAGRVLRFPPLDFPPRCARTIPWALLAIPRVGPVMSRAARAIPRVGTAAGVPWGAPQRRRGALRLG